MVTGGRVWVLGAIAWCSMLPGPALAAEAPISIRDFDVVRYAPDAPSGTAEYTQAGGHPNTNIYMQFCGEGIEIVDATNTNPVVITTAVPHGVPPGTFSFTEPARVIGVNGNLAANGTFAYSTPPATDPDAGRKITLFGAVGSGPYTNGGQLFLPAAAGTRYGCTADEMAAFLKDFTLKLPPGMLGNPTAVPACPTHLWLAGACPDSTQLGHAVIDTIHSSGMFLVSTSVFNLQTLGWEPARLGTEVVPGIPPGPLPNTVTLRTAPDPGEMDEPNQQGADAFEGDQGDYGISSYQINIPKELGGSLQKVRAIDIVLCAYVPCQETLRNAATSIVPRPDLSVDGEVHPFFTNPTSCGTKTVRLEARSYSPDDPAAGESIEEFREADLPVDGCENVPFDPAVTLVSEDASPGTASRHTISIDHPDHADDPIWQAQLRRVDITLPVGLDLADREWLAGQCTYAEFGVSSTAPHAPLDNGPVECGDRSQFGLLEIESPVAPVPLGGRLFLGPRPDGDRPTLGAPWPVFILVEGGGVRIKLVGTLSRTETDALRLELDGIPELPFTHIRLRTDAEVLKNPETCGAHAGSAVVTAHNGGSVTRDFSLDLSPCIGSESLVAEHLPGSPLLHAREPLSPAGPATHLGDPEGISLSGNRIAYVAGLGQTNRVTVSRTSGEYTVTDTGVGVIPDGDGAGGCSVAGQTATCPAAGVTQVFIEVLDGNDEVDGGPGDDTILGGSGGDDLDGRAGNDTIDSGLGDPLDEAFDLSVGGVGFNTLTFALDPERAASAPGPIRVDKREDFAVDSDGKAETVINFTQLIGTPFDDEIVGGNQAETLVGLDGADTLCGGLGVDTVDYSRSTQAVTVTLDGTQPTDPDLALQLVPDPGGPGTEELRLRYLRARHDCRETLKPEDTVPPSRPGDPKPGGTRDCTRDDGAPGENDCVGEDVENIVGSPHGDVLVGNDVDPLEGRGPRVEPLGANLIQGGGGDDLMDGRGGPDVYEGGAGHDTVTYGGVPGIARFPGRNTPVSATIDEVADDGSAVDRNRANLTDSINTDIERIVGTGGDDVLRGSSGNEELVGAGGNDFVDGGGGHDHIEGNDGNDAVLGGAGNDVLRGGVGNDDLDGWAGNDDMAGEDGDDRLRGGPGDDLMSGGDGIDLADYSDARLRLEIDLGVQTEQNTLGAGRDTVTGLENLASGAGGDVLAGSSEPNQVSSGAGDDQIDLRDGTSDTVSCGPGTDAVLADPDDQADADCEQVDLGPEADLSVTKSDSSDPVVVGTTLSYTVVVRNDGPATASGVKLVDTLPSGVGYRSADPSQGSCSEASGTVTCDFGDLVTEGTATATITVSADAAGTITNSASVLSDARDPVEENNTVTESTRVVRLTYPAPLSASPVRVSLVPAFAACGTPNRTHGPPLANPSCNPPRKSSSYLTVGTPDSNGEQARFTGHVRFGVMVGDPATSSDEADVKLDVTLGDIRTRPSLSDYTGELQASVGVRATDHSNGSSLDEPATVEDFALSFRVPCAENTDPAVGGACRIATTADAVIAGSVQERKQAIWQLGQIRVFDGGDDGFISTGDNTVFLKQGIFVP